jgi:hypothetical protein
MSFGKTDLMDGDILLFQGNRWLSRMIRKFDGSDVNHAAIYYKNDTVAEAEENGVVANPYATSSVKGCEWFQVYRLKSKPGTLDPVLGIAQKYLSQGNRYAFESLVFLALICTVRHLPVTPILRTLLNTIFENAADLILKITSGGKEPMICSEFVYRCYDEALSGSQDIYSIQVDQIRPAKSRLTQPGVKRFSLQEIFASEHVGSMIKAPTGLLTSRVAEFPAENLDALIQDYFNELDAKGVETDVPSYFQDVFTSYSRFVQTYSAKSMLAANRIGTLHLTAALPGKLPLIDGVNSTFVTPGDLFFSPSLDLIGRI